MRPRDLFLYACTAGLGIALGTTGTRWAIGALTARGDGPSPVFLSASRPEPLHPDPEKWDEMVTKLQRMALNYPGRVGVYIKDLRGGREWVYHADDLFPSASLIKLPVMACVFKRMHAGDGLNLDTTLTLRRTDRVGGSGRLKWAPDGSHYTIREILDRMITESDNTALRMLLDEIGMDYFQREFSGLGLSYTQIHPEGLSLKNRRIPNENYTTAREMAGLLERMYRGELVDRFSSEMMIEYMKGLKTRKRLARPLPVGWQLAHKTGLLRGACHDVGIVMTPQGEYIVAVLTAQNPDYHAAKSFIERLAATSYHFLRADSDLAFASKSRSSQIR